MMHYAAMKTGRDEDEDIDNCVHPFPEEPQDEHVVDWNGCPICSGCKFCTVRYSDYCGDCTYDSKSQSCLLPNSCEGHVE